jgi:hypothetical protein
MKKIFLLPADSRYVLANGKKRGDSALHDFVMAGLTRNDRKDYFVRSLFAMTTAISVFLVPFCPKSLFKGFWAEWLR